jgi:hypothetical protein
MDQKLSEAPRPPAEAVKKKFWLKGVKSLDMTRRPGREWVTTPTYINWKRRNPDCEMLATKGTQEPQTTRVVCISTPGNKDYAGQPSLPFSQLFNIHASRSKPNIFKSLSMKSAIIPKQTSKQHQEYSSCGNHPQGQQGQRPTLNHPWSKINFMSRFKV